MKPIFIKIFFLLLTGTTVCASYAQTQITYAYDAAGNRIGRAIVMTRSAVASNIIADDEEEEKVAEEAKEEEPPVFLDVLDKSGIRIYPNPTKGVLKIEISNLPEDKPATVQVYDMAGRMLIQQPDILFSTEVNISDQPDGTYILKIVSGNHATNWKIIKQ